MEDHYSKEKWNEDEAILHSLQDDIMVTNLEGVILKASKMTGQIYEVETTELIGKSVYELEKKGLFTPIATPMVIKERKKITFVQTTSKGKKLLVTGIPVFDSQGELARIVSYSHDVTELMNLKEYLQVMEEDMERVKSELHMLRDKHTYAEGIIAHSSEMQKVLDISSRAAEVDANVLLLGESGVGKSHLAKFIHHRSQHSKGPFIEVNCGAIPETLFEAEFFGYEAGAFTGANRQGKVGLAELAEGGTLFLDEIGELSPLHQVKLLKFIQEKQFYRVGGTKLRRVDFRLIAATNQELRMMVNEKRFREDLYFRLNVVPVTIPPLRKRTEDILPLIEYFLQVFTRKYDRIRKLDGAVIQRLVYYNWKGNVRELMNVLEHLVVMSPAPLITLEHLPGHITASYQTNELYEDNNRTLPEILERVEKEILTKARKQYKTTAEIAKAIGISQPSVVRKLKKHKIK
jgi:transcriptional regulator with PAS, ATPase and Fis domain